MGFCRFVGLSARRCVGLWVRPFVGPLVRRFFVPSIRRFVRFVGSSDSSVLRFVLFVGSSFRRLPVTRIVGSLVRRFVRFVGRSVGSSIIIVWPSVRRFVGGPPSSPDPSPPTLTSTPTHFCSHVTRACSPAASASPPSPPLALETAVAPPSPLVTTTSPTPLSRKKEAAS